MVSTTLSEIKPGKELWKIKARVTRLWNAILISSGEQLSLDMILIDQEVTVLHHGYKFFRLISNFHSTDDK